MTWTEISAEWGEWVTKIIGAFAAVAAAVAGLYRYVIKPGYMWIRSTHEMFEKLDSILYQLSPNSGGSLRDAIDRIEQNQTVAMNRLRSFFSDSQTAYFEADEYGGYVWANKTFLDLTGRSLQDVMGAGWELVIEQGKRKEFVEEWQRAIESERDFESSVTVVRLGRTSLPCSVSAHALRDNKGVVRSYIGTIIPVV
jgi:PAS domain S-box-containing protein